MTKKTVMLMVLLVGVFTLRVTAVVLPPASTPEFEDACLTQTLDEVLARVNPTNLGDVLSKADSVLLATVPMSQPGELVRGYLELDPGYCDELATYFGVTITS